jgi:asparagine synthase (glutamine-hydrolysing)
MCGIAGWLNFEDLEGNPEILRAMTSAIRHRGPDGEGYHEAGPIHLGHRRLSIIDVAGSPQPMTNEDSTVWLIFNGEIFNFQELRDSLLKAGHRFRTAGDTETIVHAYEQYGEDFLNHLQGQFALALWDQKKEVLILARDRMGQLPLYYFRPDRNRIFFGSELKALLKHPAVPQQVDADSLDAYLAFKYIPEPQTIYTDVFKLPAAHKLVMTRSECRIERYWRAPFGNEIEMGEVEALQRLDSLFTDAVRSRLISDVPLGAFLSGGIDSSLVVAYMAANSSRPIQTFTIGFDQESHDERRYARQVADRFKTEHHEFVVTPEAADVIPRMAAAFDEPFADSSALPVYYLAQMTRQHVTVALNGDGGDESFAGYRRYFAAAKFERYRKLPRVLRNFVGAMARVAAKSPLKNRASIRRLNRWRNLENASLGKIYQQAVEWPTTIRHELLSPEMLQRLKTPQNQVSEAVDGAIGNDTLNRIMQGDQQAYLPGDLLVKVDRMCMQHSLEGRSPFLDYRIVEFAASLSSRTKAPRFQSKFLLKKLLRKFFPQEFVERKKMGFGVPIATWFKNSPYLNDMLTQAAEKSDFLDGKKVKHLQNEHHANLADHSNALWAIVMLEAWKQNCNIN